MSPSNRSLPSSSLLPKVEATSSLLPSSSSSSSCSSWHDNHSARSLEAQTSSLESRGIHVYHPPGSDIPPKRIGWVYNPTDGSVLMDHKGRPVSVDRLLATKPLKGELSTRPGPGNKKLTYIAGDGVTRILNDIFGFDGWNLDVTKVTREECLHDKATGKYSVTYTAMVKVTHRVSGTYKEDVGSGDATDRCFGTAVSHALKGSITDAMKRAARHFGEKLGNSLYNDKFNIKTAPATLKDALDKYEIERANSKFGFPKNQQLSNTAQSLNLSAPNQVVTSDDRQQTDPPKQSASSFKQVVSSAAAASNLHHPSHGGRILPIAPSNIPAQQVQTITTGKPQEVRVLPVPVTAPKTDGAASCRPNNHLPQQPAALHVQKAIKRQSSHNPSIQQPASDSSEISNQQSRHAQILPRPPPSHNAAITSASSLAVAISQGSSSYNNGSVTFGPPPTPIDSLRNSALFHGFDDETNDDGLIIEEYVRPKSSYGKQQHQQQMTASTTTSDHRRSSIGDGLPIRPPPLVTPTTNSVISNKNNHQRQYQQLHPLSHNKRPALESISSNVDSTANKRQTTNPYHSGARM